MTERAVSKTDWLPIALGVLPALPHKTTLLLDDGGQLSATLLEVTDQGLLTEMAVLDARTGLRLTIPVESADRGGYSISCAIDEVYFMGGLSAAALLCVEHVARRKPYRLKERAATDANVKLILLASSAPSVAGVLVGRMLDISSSGAGLLLDQELAVGDRVQVEADIPGVVINAQATVVQVARAPFGRWRLGCQFTMLPPNQERGIDQFVSSSNSADAPPSAAATTSAGRIYLT